MVLADGGIVGGGWSQFQRQENSKVVFAILFQGLDHVTWVGGMAAEELLWNSHRVIKDLSQSF